MENNAYEEKTTVCEVATIEDGIPPWDSAAAPQVTSAAAKEAAVIDATGDVADHTSYRKRPTLPRFHRRGHSEVNLIIKYVVFFFNVILWVLGGFVLGIGTWAAIEKDFSSNIYTLSSSVLDPGYLLIISGVIVFVVGLIGWIGALREYTWLLLIYMICVLITLLFLIIAAILVFACKSWFQSQVLQSSLANIIPQYSDDPNLQDLIDWVQGQWLYCCGVSGYTDWQFNAYFNCSSPGEQACGVPFSCCLPNSDYTSGMSNLDCGYNVMNNIYPEAVIYTKGCLAQGEAWFTQYVIPIAGATVAVIVIQILSVGLAWTLRSDINAQKAKWNRISVQ